MKNRIYSIGAYIFVPVMGVITLLMIILYVIFSFGDVVNNITNESYDNLQEKAENQRNYLENKMTYEWSSIGMYVNSIEDKMSQYIKDHDYDIETVLEDADVNSEMLILVSGDLTDMLRNTKTTGSFVILEGRATATSTSSAVKPGLYIRDDDPNVNSIYNSDVMIETGVPKVCDKVSLPMSSTWASTFNMNSDRFTSTDFYYKPYDAYALALYNNDDISDLSNYGYWSTGFKTDPAGDEMISYSVPFVVDGHLFGVIGVDINIDLIWSMLTDYSDVEGDMSYILGCSEEDSDILNVIQSVGSMYTHYFNHEKTLQFHSGEMNSFYLYKENERSQKVVSYGAKLQLYNNNTPFEHTQWMIVSCKSKADIMDYTTKTRKQIMLFVLITVLSMGVSLALLCKNISKPVKKLSKEVQDSNLSIDGKFSMTKIKEINELIGSFENMRKIILDNSNKISEIVSLTKLPLGVYEYDSSVGMTFCSETLLEMLCWKEYANNGYISDSVFEEKMKSIKANAYDQDNDIYEIENEHGVRWLQIHSVNVDDKQFGTIMDVSGDVINQIKMEYERDYDVLTGLLNRRAYQSKVTELLTNREKIKIGAMIMMDSDNLKFINDSYGHDTGDAYLKQIAGSFTFFKDYNYISGRFSGDEFYIFLYGFEHKDKIRTLVNHFWVYLNSQTIELPDGSEFSTRCSAGVAWYPDDGDSTWQLEQYADFAMYEMKHNSKGKWAEFNKKHFADKEILLKKGLTK